MLKVYHSNRLERLVGRLMEITQPPPGNNPLAPEVVITQSQGMARWLSIAFAQHRSIAANIEFLLPATFVWRVFAGQLPGVVEHSPFEREVLAWRLMELLPGKLDRPSFEPLRRYLAGERSELKRFQLCRRIADVFDQYLMYRPDVILQWDEGGGTDWQAELWRGLSRGGPAHRAALLGRFLAEDFIPDPGRLPQRVSVFGIPTLPPAFIEVFSKIGQVVPVHLFTLNPCLLYWGDIEAERNIARIRRQRAQLAEPTSDYRISGNSLLASMGKQGRDFIDALHGHTADEEELFEAPEAPGMLGALQSDILLLEEGGRLTAKRSIAPDDDSIQIHVCHSPMREVEVLHDRLLALFHRDRSLGPQDVLVMAPDIEAYAPFIEAVFGAASGVRHIPWAVADLSRRSTHPLVQAFLQLLELPTSRLSASEVLSLLEIPAVLRRHGLNGSDFETVRRWVRESGIRWGASGEGRARFELPAFEANSWSFGFQRLLLGYAMPPGEARLFRGVLPYADLEGQEAVLLGRLRTFLERLTQFVDRLARPRQGGEWASVLNELLDAFFEPGPDDAEPLQAIRDALAALVEEIQRAAYTGALTLDVVREDLQGRLAAPGAGQRFLTGRLTFCAMLPMRSLPFRIICLLGMNDGAFPRQHRAPGFDKMAERPRRGDRSRREDDRYLFLESLISARQILYLSYVGRNIRDNAPLLPSVVVSELLDAIDQTFDNGGAAARAHVLIEHPLQPFSPRCFGGGERPLFSYAREWLAVAAAQNQERMGQPAFCPQPLPPTEVSDEPIELVALSRFFQHPARAFLQSRLGVRLNEGLDVLEDSEPFGVDGLARHQLHEEMLAYLLQGSESDAWRQVALASGRLPHPHFAERLLDGETPVLEALADTLRPYLTQRLDDAEVDIDGGDWRLMGWLTGRTRQGRVRWRVGTVKPRDRLALWVEHLVLNALASADCPPSSVLIAPNGTAAFRPVEDALGHLRPLIALYREGLCEPLPFFPDASFAFAQAVRGGKDGRTAARAVWEGNRFGGRPEGGDAYHRIAFRGADPFGPRFEEIAHLVCDPLLRSLEEPTEEG